MCSASTVYTSIRESALVPGKWAVFPGGGGGMGSQGVQLAVATGRSPVIIDSEEEKRKLALELGAEAFLDFKESKDLASEVIAICDAIRAHGVMCIALPTLGAHPITVSGAELIMKNKLIKGTMVSSMADVEKTLEFAKRGKFHFNPEIVGLSRLNESLQRLKKGQVPGRIVLDFNLE
ncbi:hypothetical protein PENVUL_c033G09042 [Penicillium vulpinum]|uniref:Alcohol dehydrogenase-like C-terminal domain-containing protein n=1 Tax=Penicillium vulpinum TaxID=29845 RepID=A0A1V6RSC4_9EURO|nr:hypothetical protein PENVUL_c033G09042 [Penicillium vulpinum]